MQTDAEMAKALVGTRTLPPGLKKLEDLSREAWAYHKLDPYPEFHFRDWQTENRGPLPRCLPIARRIVKRGARFLFGKPLELICSGNEAWETFLRGAWEANKMPARLVPMAIKGALETGIVLKFAYDAASDPQLSIQSLSPIKEVRLYPHPHDRMRVLMARVQYQYFDPLLGKTMWYREEWTDAEEVHYWPVADETLLDSKMDPDTFEGWKIESREANKFSLIPMLYIQNQETDDTWGALDLDDLYRVLDNIHLTFHLMNRSNQFDADTNPIFIDADMDEQDVDKPLQPGQPIDLKSEEGSAHQAKVEFPGGGNSLRPAMMEYAKELTRQVEDAASTVNVNQAEFTNKGNLTSAVLQQLYQPQIEITDEKRKSWGQNGLCVFLARVARALANLRVPGLAINPQDPKTYAVEIKWPSYFDLSQDELTALTGRTQEQQIAGYITQERAVERVAQAEGISDIKALQEELEKEPRPTPTENDPNLQNVETEVKGLDRLGGENAK